MRRMIKGKEVVILNEDNPGTPGTGFTSIEVDSLIAKMKDLYPEEQLVKMEADFPPGFRNMPLMAVIKSNIAGNDSMGWKKHKKALKDEGFDV